MGDVVVYTATPVARSATAETSATVRQSGQEALTISTSMASSNDRSGTTVVGRVLPSRWLITRRQPLDVVHGGRRN